MRPLAGRLDLCSINTATLGHRAPIAAIVEDVARAGFGAIAPWRREIENEDVRSVARQIRDAGLKLSGYCRSAYFPAATREAAQAAIEDNRHALRVAATLGAPCFVLVCGGLAPGSRDLGGARAQVREGVAALLEEARALNVTLAIEPLHPMYAADRSCIASLDEAIDLCEALDPEARGGVGVALDVYHVWWDAGLDAAIGRASEGRRIAAFHVCDWLVPTRDLLLDRGMMGDGVIEIPRIRSRVEAAGYDGHVEVEIFSAQDWWKRSSQETLRICAQRLQSIC